MKTLTLTASEAAASAFSIGRLVQVMTAAQNMAPDHAFRLTAPTVNTFLLMAYDVAHGGRRVFVREVEAAPLAPLFKPGVFEYHGMGSGMYWTAAGEGVSCTRTEAYALADADGLRMVTLDRLRISSGYTRDWRAHLAADLSDSGPYARADDAAQALRQSSEGMFPDRVDVEHVRAERFLASRAAPRPLTPA